MLFSGSCLDFFLHTSSFVQLFVFGICQVKVVVWMCLRSKVTALTAIVKISLMRVRNGINGSASLVAVAAQTSSFLFLNVFFYFRFFTFDFYASIHIHLETHKKCKEFGWRKERVCFAGSKNYKWPLLLLPLLL